MFSLLQAQEATLCWWELEPKARTKSEVNFNSHIEGMESIIYLFYLT